MSDVNSDRYVSFCNIDCDQNADRLIEMLDHHIAAGNGSELWQQYFIGKRTEQKKMQRDNLNFVGSQTNPLYEYFEDCDDQTATDLLYKIEQECC